jgi:BirA family biotin operon repressor/biotin-[acetyl-CoA-carboxylase] ligase
MLKQGSISKIENDYLHHLKGFEQWQNYASAEGTFEGKITGVDEFGRLIVESRDGMVRMFSHGEIQPFL